MQEIDDFFWIKESAEFVKIKSNANIKIDKLVGIK